MYSLYLCQCLLLEGFWGFIYKFGDVFMTRNMSEKLNSYLYQLAYGKIGFAIAISLKVVISKNLLMMLNEGLLNPFPVM